MQTKCIPHYFWTPSDLSLPWTSARQGKPSAYSQQRKRTLKPNDWTEGRCQEWVYRDPHFCHPDSHSLRPIASMRSPTALLRHSVTLVCSHRCYTALGFGLCLKKKCARYSELRDLSRDFSPKHVIGLSSREPSGNSQASPLPKNIMLPTVPNNW